LLECPSIGKPYKNLQIRLGDTSFGTYGGSIQATDSMSLWSREAHCTQYETMGRKLDPPCFSSGSLREVEIFSLVALFGMVRNGFCVRIIPSKKLPFSDIKEFENEYTKSVAI
jgi:hypothetical protein